jgi:hypothetical protein
MTLLQQKRLADLRLQLERTLDKRDETLDRLVRLTTKVKALTKAVERAQKRMAAEPKPVARPVVIAPPPAPAAIPAPVIDDEIPGFLKRSRPDAVGQQIAAEIEARHKAKSRGRIAKMKAKQSGETKKMPLEGKDALKAIFG